MTIMTFNNQTKDWLIIRPQEARWMAPLMDRPSFNIPGRHGAHFGRATLRPRVQPIPIGIHHNGFEDLQQKKKELSEWLVTLDEKFRDLTFSDEPDIKYRAFLSTPLGNIVENHNFTTGVLEFTCEPFKYALEPRAVPLSESTTITYNGSAEQTDWFLQVNFTDSTNSFSITHVGQQKTVTIDWNFISGDVLTIDSSIPEIRINGNVQSASFRWRTSEYFELTLGNNIIESSHDSAELTFTERWT